MCEGHYFFGCILSFLCHFCYLFWSTPSLFLTPILRRKNILLQIMVGGVEGGWRPISLPPVSTALHYHKSWLLCYRSSNALLTVSIKIFKRNKVNCNCEMNVPCARLLEVNYCIPQLGFNFIKIFLYLQVFASVAVTLTFDKPAVPKSTYPLV